MIKIGFTGTQSGMTIYQKVAFERIISKSKATEFHHGDCIGADAQAHDIVRKVLPDCKIVVHPPKYSVKRAFKQGDEIREKDGYLERNKSIVNETKVLFATPAQDEEITRSGTWATVRKARKDMKVVFLIFPDGRLDNSL